MPADPRDAEIAHLRSQVAYLATALAKAIDPPPEEWISFPRGQCVPASFVMSTPAKREAMGFRWDGNTPVFPSSWPRVAPVKDLGDGVD